MKTIKEKAKEIQKELEAKELSPWQKGYEAGANMVLREHGNAMKLGKAILDVLDDIYEFKKEDY